MHARADVPQSIEGFFLRDARAEESRARRVHERGGVFEETLRARSRVAPRRLQRRLGELVRTPIMGGSAMARRSRRGIPLPFGRRLHVEEHRLCHALVA